MNKIPLYGVQYEWTSDNSLVDFPINSKTHIVSISPSQAKQTQAQIYTQRKQKQGLC